MSLDSLGIDLNGDNEADVLFTLEALSSCDEPPSTRYVALHVETRHAEILTSPYTNGEVISPTPPPGDVWMTAGRYEPTLVSSWMQYDWESGSGEGHSQGPWYGTRDGYLPVRLSVEDRYHYGWRHLTLAYITFNNMTDFWWMAYQVLDCGLEAAPGTPIAAGHR